MAKKIKTILTFGIKIDLPTGGDASSMQKYLRDAIQSYGGGFEKDHPYFELPADSFTVALQKKETQYG